MKSFAILAVIFFLYACHQHKSHDFIVEKGIVTIDTTKETLLDSSIVSRGIYKGKSVYLVKSRPTSKRLNDSSVYVLLSEQVKINAGNLGNKDDVSADFVFLYDEKELKPLTNSQTTTKTQTLTTTNTTTAQSRMLNCSITGTKICYNTQGVADPDDVITTLGPDKYYPMNNAMIHDHVTHAVIGVELQYVKMTTAAEYQDFKERILKSQKECNNMKFDKMPDSEKASDGITRKIHIYNNNNPAIFELP
ncbi:MAG: hypothetical protein IPO92_05525 [Saprospiraceae bacterium]|nr:hypothetical protein [Saprospiraceae bacterium]